MPKLKQYPPPKPADPVVLLTTSQLAERLGIVDKQVYAWVARGLIPATCVLRFGRTIRFDSAAIGTWLESLRAAPLAA